MDMLWFKARRVISILLVFAMLASVTPVQAFAAEEPSAETASSDMMPEEEPSVTEETEQTNADSAEEVQNSEEEEAEAVPPEADSSVEEAPEVDTAPVETPQADSTPAEVPEADNAPVETPAEETAQEEPAEEEEAPAASAPSEEVADSAENEAEPAGDAQADSDAETMEEPAVSQQTLNASADSMNASVTAALPTETKLIVTKMSGDELGDDRMQSLMEAVNSNEICEIEAYDITLTDAQGNTYTLPEGQTATVTLNGISLQAAEGQTLYAVHLKADGSVDMGTINGSTVTFTVDSFSPFVVAAVGSASVSVSAPESQPVEQNTSETAAPALASVLAGPVETYASNHYYFRNDTNDKNIEGVKVTVYYSINGSTNLQILPNNGGRVDVSNKKPIAFYVKVEIEDGYNYTPDDLRISFTAGEQDGEVNSINDPGIKFFGLVNFTNAVKQAKSLGCLYEFHYKDYFSEHAGEGGVRAFSLVLKDDVEHLTKITYHSNDENNLISESTVVQNKTAALLGSDTFTRDQYTLVGWNTEPDGSGTHYAPGSSYTVGNSSVDLYAEWQRNTVTVTYDANGGSWSNGPLIETPDTGSDYTVTNQEPSRKGYAFQGWNTKADGSGTAYASGATINQIQSALTLYAQWKNVQAYSVTVSLSAVSGTMLKSTTKNDVQWDTLSTYKTMTGYELANAVLETAFTADSGVSSAAWNCAVQEDVLSYRVTLTIDDDSADLVTVTYAGNGGSGNVPASVTLLKGSSYTVEGQGNLSKTNYTFTGWMNSGDNKVYNAEKESQKTIQAINSDITLTAQWQQIVFQIQYLVDDPERGNVTPSSEEVGAGNQANGSTAEANTGWYFVNWTDKNNKVVSTQATLKPNDVSEDQVYTAHFDAQTDITVKAADLEKTYNGTSLTANNEVQLTAGVLAQGHTLQAVTTATENVTNVGQTGEHTISSLQVVDGDGNDVTYLYNITKVNGSMTINPKPLDVTVSFQDRVYDKDNLTVQVAGASIDAGQVISGDTVTVSAAGNGTISTDSVQDGAAVTSEVEPALSGADAGNYTVGNVSYGTVNILGVVTYDTNAGDDDVTWSEPDEIRYHKDALVVPTENLPTRKGYTCLGWSVDPAAQTPDAPFAMGDTGLKLYAVWQAQDVAVNVTYHYGTEEPVTTSIDNKKFDETLTIGMGEYDLQLEAKTNYQEAAYTLSSVTVNGDSIFTLSADNYQNPTMDETVKLNELTMQVDVYYVADNGGDGIPDQYQVTVNYAVSNGFWNDNTDTVKSEKVTLLNGDSQWDETGSGVLSAVPEVGEKADAGYTAGGWNAAPETAVIRSGDEGKTFTYTYAVDADRQYTVTYSAQANGSVTAASEKEQVLNNAGLQGSAATPADGYVFDGWYKGDSKISSETVLSAETVRANLNKTVNEHGMTVYQDTTFMARFTIRADLGYTVRYLEDGTASVLASEKIVSGQTFGATVTETAPDIAGYTLTSDKNPQSITIGTGENVITFYYKAVGAETETTPAPTESPAPLVTPTTPAAPTAPTAPTASAGPAVTAAPEEVTEEPAEEQIQDQETPLAPNAGEEETIGDEETPLAGGSSAWALLNLILTILTALGSVVLVIGYFGKKRSIWHLISLIPGIGAIVAFVLTQDMSQKMAFVDRWTLLMVIIAVVQIVIAALGMKNKPESDEDSENA